MMDGIRQTRLNPIFSCLILAECGFTLPLGRTFFSYWQVQGVFLEDCHAHILGFESISLYRDYDFGLKTQNEQNHGDPTVHII